MVSYLSGRVTIFIRKRESHPFLTIGDNRPLLLGVRPVGAKPGVLRVCTQRVPGAPLPDGINRRPGSDGGAGKCESALRCGLAAASA